MAEARGRREDGALEDVFEGFFKYALVEAGLRRELKVRQTNAPFRL